MRDGVRIKPSAVTISQAFQVAGQHLAAGRLAEAESLGWQLLQAQPGHPDLRNLLGLIAVQRGELEAAAQHFEQAIAARPDFPPYHSNLSVVRRAQGRLEDAVNAGRRAVTLDPRYTEAHLNLAIALADLERLDEALAAYRAAIALTPAQHGAWGNMGNVLKRQGRLEEALAAYRQAMALRPDDATAHGMWVQNLRYHPGYDAAAIAREEAQWDARHAAPLRPAHAPAIHSPDPDRRLRVGYVSADFRDHVVGRNVLPLLERHDHERFEVFCYSDARPPDAITGRFRAAADHWRDTAGLADDALAETIRGDAVDILVDLAQHTAGNRLLALARQPAPVQASFAGYPGGAGISAVAHRISDPYLEKDDGGMQPGVHTLESFWCYAAFAEPLEIPPLPASGGRVTFGCLNHCWKVNAAVLRLWARVLREIPEARLVIQSPEGSHRREPLAMLAGEGVPEERVSFIPRLPRDQYLEAYRALDIVLDTFPYGGHTTSLDAFWMGVPVVSRSGETIVSRAGLSQAMNLGLPELVALSDDDFVRIATGLARDLPRLAELRATLRDRMQRSVLMDAPRFARSIEAAYRAMWRQTLAR